MLSSFLGIILVKDNTSPIIGINLINFLAGVKNKEGFTTINLPQNIKNSRK
jgi:hypothetical protein